jgi:group I intron endonuclease
MSKAMEAKYMACGIYKITNLVNNHCYIGQSVDIKRRWRNEKAAAFNEKSKSYNTILSKAFRKYCILVDGKVDFSNFCFEILEECSVDDLNDREQYYVDKHNAYTAGYNMTEGGDTAHVQVLEKMQVIQIINCLRTDLHKNSEQIGKEFNISGRMVRNINNGTCHRLDDLEYPIRPKYVSDPKRSTFRQALVDGHSIDAAKLLVKKQMTNEQKQPVSKCPPLEELFEQLYRTSFTAVGKLYGVSATAVQKWLRDTAAPTKIKEFKLWYQQEILHEVPVVIEKGKRAIAKPVQQYSLDGKLLNEFSSLNQAAKATASNNYGSVHIREVCENKRKSAYGYYWQYAN